MKECCIGKSTALRFEGLLIRPKNTLVPGSGEGLVSGMNADHTRDHTAQLDREISRHHNHLKVQRLPASSTILEPI